MEIGEVVARHAKIDLKLPGIVREQNIVATVVDDSTSWCNKHKEDLSKGYCNGCADDELADNQL